jgi:hypothetical protein
VNIVDAFEMPDFIFKDGGDSDITDSLVHPREANYIIALILILFVPGRST